MRIGDPPPRIRSRSMRNTAPHEIHSPRLRLVLMTEAIIESFLAGNNGVAADLLQAHVPDGWPGERDRSLLEMRLDQMRREPMDAIWLIRAVVGRDDGVMMGHAGFHGPPDERGVVETGYTIFEDHRRRGYAEEAVRALFAWARRERGVERFRASVSPMNDPSLRLIKKLGFRQTGVQWDDVDGEELVFESADDVGGATP